MHGSRPPEGANEIMQASQVSPAQSSMDTTHGDTVRLNWILFKPYHFTQPLVISIPRHLYERPSQYCRPLFVPELLAEFRVATRAEDISFWTTREPLSTRDAAEDGWAASINDFNAYFEPLPLPTPFSREVVVKDNKLIHLVITVEDERPVVKHSHVDLVPEFKEFKRYNETLLTPGPTPSDGAKLTVYRKIQDDDTQAIYNGRKVPGGLVSRTGPPIQIFHPIFDDFIHLVNDPDEQPTVADLEIVGYLMHFASKVGQHGAVRACLMDILHGRAHEEIYGTEPDGGITLRIGHHGTAFMILELKPELGEGGYDPTTRCSLSMKRHWVDPSRRSVRQTCCCPTFLVTGGGPWLSVLGGVFTDKVIVQNLTDMRSMALSSTQEDFRIYHNARVLVALRKCLFKLRLFYKKLYDAPRFIDGEPHPRYFPYPTSFVAKDGSVTNFRYLASLQDTASCVTYLAEISNGPRATGDPEKVIVKFVARYGREVHELLAREGWAPTLRYCGPLSEAKLSGILPGPAQRALPGLCLRSDLMHMVVMDYIHAQSQAPPDLHTQIQAILTLMHSAGYVFGDLREQNILFDADGKVKLIDFDWCGRYNMNIRDEELPNGLQNQIDQNKKHVQAGDEGPYAYYPLSMSTVDDMWAPGMKPLAQIRPQHDWMMFEKLYTSGSTMYFA